MHDKKEAQLSNIIFNNNHYNVFSFNNEKYIDIQAFWKQEINLRDDLFKMPQVKPGIYQNPTTSSFEEVYLAEIEDLYTAISAFDTYYALRDYMNENIYNRLKLFTSALREVDFNVNSKTVDLYISNQETFLSFE